jgi:RNA polymerase sigma factor (sigma-70 family)
MASGALGGSLRHLRDLFGDGTAVGLGDAQLLARYAASRDEAAFAALVARHGPMVLATCRAVLRNEHDIEDAFQATFLVLARKARSVRGGDALGGWLHRVAYRVSVQAGAESRRRRREAEAAAMTPLAVTHAGPEPDVASIVHEELDRLPDRHRLPVVLCDLEGLTYEQAAGRLRWTEPTLRHRLVQARHRLRQRLLRRGVTAGAMSVILAAQASAARAAVPAALARSAVAAAAGGATSATVATLAAALIRSMTMTQLKIISAGILAAIALTSAGALAVGSRRADPPGAAMPPQAGAEMKRPPDSNRATAPSTAPAEPVEVRGRVVGPDGKPVPGATVRTAWVEPDDPPAPDATSAPDGRFVMRVARPGRSVSAIVGGGDAMPWLVATAPGFGPGWAARILQPDAPRERTIRLAADGPPIEGRIVDLEGRPVAGARVQVDRLWYAMDRRSWYVETGDLPAWFRRVQDLGINQGPWDGLAQLSTAIAAATTDRDGRFRLTGIGRRRIAELSVSGPTIATTLIYAICHDGPEVRCRTHGSAAAPTIVFHAPRFEHAVAPTRPIEGVIRDKDTGRPIAGVRIRGDVYKEHSLLWHPGVEATSDARGHYRLAGLNTGPAYRLFLEPKEGLPYPRATLRTPAASPALEPITFDIAMKRGILVRGRVTDRASGRPVPGLIGAYAFRDNPHVREFPGYEESYPPRAYVRDDGRFEVVALPGRGIITCLSDLRRYRLGFGAEAIQGNRPIFDTLPSSVAGSQVHAVAAVDLDPRAETATRDLQVDPGRSLAIHAVDPEGKPVGKIKVLGVTSYSVPEEEQVSPTIEILALDPSEPRRVTITHEGRKLVGSVYLKGEEAGPLTVRLQPWGTVAGRVVDEDGQPRGGVVIQNLYGYDLRQGDDRGILPGSYVSPGLRLGRDGRFRIEGLVPGLKYGGFALEDRKVVGDLFRELTVAPGEVKDLGDLKIAPSRPGR